MGAERCQLSKIEASGSARQVNNVRTESSRRTRIDTDPIPCGNRVESPGTKRPSRNQGRALCSVATTRLSSTIRSVFGLAESRLWLRQGGDLNRSRRA